MTLHATPASSEPDKQPVAPRRLNAWAVGALAAAALSAVVGLGASPQGILGGNAQERWHDTPCPDGVTVPLVNASSRVLVTGGAGFIGMSLMASLGKRDARTRPAVVVGVDSFNDYYAPAMKRGRAARLKQEFGYDVVEADVCNTSVVDGLFERYTFTHVVHLAAQAGVRYSITHPMTYARNNLECVVSLLEYVAHRNPQPAYVYASSSSVYGLNKKIPFSELHAIDHPANLYGISKFAGEQIAAAYHNLHGLKSVGLRFFTVYGPWGRPDMAISLFTNEIENGETITLFNGGDMRRDFTYVDDAVRGVEFAMQYCADNAAVFNLGNSKPVKLGYVLEQIEKRLGVKAKFKYQASNAEMKETYADISKARELLGYSPTTSIEKGLDQFMAWYNKLDKRTRGEWAGGRFKAERQNVHLEGTRGRV